MVYCIYCTSPEDECCKVCNMPLKVCSKWLTKFSRPESAGSFSWQQWIDAEWPSLPSICMGKRTPCHPSSGLTLACRMRTLRSCSEVSSPKKQMRTQRNAWSSSGTGPVQRMATAVQPLTVCWRTVFSLTVMGCSHSGWVSSAQKQDGDQYPPKTIQHHPVGLQHYIRAQKKNDINFIEDVKFFPIWNLLKSLYCKLHADGVGCSMKKQ